MLHTIYKHYIKGVLTDEEMQYIEMLEERKVSYSDSIEDRKAQLMYTFAIYDELIKKGLSKEQALLELAENTKSMKRKSDELERIIKEEKMNKKSSMEVYKNSLKVDTKNLIQNKENNILQEQVMTEIEEESKGDEK